MRTNDARHAPASDSQPYVRLFDWEPALLRPLPGPTADFLREHGTVPCVHVDRGPWHPPAHRASTRNWLGLLVLDGFVTRPVSIGRRRVHELLGPGDVLRPWDHRDYSGLVAAERPWSVLSPLVLAVLDHDFATVACRTPEIVVELLSRATHRGSQLGAAVAIADAPGLEAKVRALVGYARERWYAPRAHGPAVDAGLTASVIAAALSAETDAVETVLEGLVGEAAVRRDDGRLILD